jgi:hypothetical protein
MWANKALVRVEPNGTFSMEPGSLVRNGLNSANEGGGVYVADPSSLFTMKGTARVTGTDVFLETGALITLLDSLGTVPARITPRQYPADLNNSNTPVVQVLTGSWVSAAHDKFEVTDSTPPPDWESPVVWRVDSGGHLVHMVARLTRGGGTEYFSNLTLAFAACPYNPPPNDPNANLLTLISNIDMSGTAYYSVQMGNRVRLTVDPGKRYTIKRKSSSSPNPVILVDAGAVLELGAPAGSRLIIDGGANWNGGNPANFAALSATAVLNTGYFSRAALISVAPHPATPGTLILRDGVVLQNNDNRGDDGGAVRADGAFEMYGGLITHNRALVNSGSGGNGGGVYFGDDKNFSPVYHKRIIAGGSIRENVSERSGGGIMLALDGPARLAMTGGEITGNRAGGKHPGLVHAQFLGFGGGVFVPSCYDDILFSMTGGTISGNKSDSGVGNGVAVDKLLTQNPYFGMGGLALIGDDICLNTITGCSVTLISNVSYTGRITMNQAPPASGLQVLSGGPVSGNYMKFSASYLGTPYAIHADGAAYP